MKNDSSSVMSSYFIGVVMILIGPWVEQMLIFLGIIIIASASACKLIESHNVKVRTAELEKKDAAMKKATA